MGAHNEIDVGSLVWVKGEIDQAIERARQCMGQFQQNPGDASQLKFARTHLHQVTGAVQMVGLDGVARFCEEIEALVSAFEKTEVEASADHIAAIEQALTDLGVYLEDLINGAPDHTLKLYPAYERLKTARGAQKFSASELFFPSLDVFSLPANPAPSVADTELPGFVKAQRTRYELGLLKWLRGSTDDGLLIMKQTLEAISQAVKSPRQRTFWWTASGLIDAIQHDALNIDYAAKQIFARINIQLRRLAEGSQTVADRLQRDILYFLAKSQPLVDSVRQIRESFVLDELMPSSVSIEQGDAASAQKVARECKELLNQAKEAWIRYTGGNADRLQTLRELLSQLRDASEGLQIAGLSAMFHALANAIDAVPAEQLQESAAMDVATAFLLLEGIYDRPNQLSPDLPLQLDAMTKRLTALANPSLDAQDLPDLPQLDQLSRDAQEKMLQSQLMHEVQVNLQHIEQVLDAFFRDNSKRDELPGLANYFRQIFGALTMVELSKAAELLLLAQDAVRHYEDSSVEVDRADLEQIAEALSTLGFYVEQVHFDKPNKDDIIDPILRKLRGDVEEELVEETVEQVTVESEVDQQKQQAQELLQSLRDNPEDAAVQQQLRSTLQTLQQNADLIADSDLGAQSAAALDVLKGDGGASSEQLVAAVSELVGERSQAESVSRPAPVSDEAVDAELLEVYLEEAVEVLANIQANQDVARHNPRDKEALTVIRRSFHTLKGSGRMVGLNHLGEVAWAVEQVMNKWLQDDLPANPALQHLISMAHQGFGGWVAELRERGSAAVEASAIFELAEALKNGQEPAVLPSMAAPVAAAVEQGPTPALAEPEPEPTAGELTLESLPGLDVVAEPLPEVAAEPQLVLPQEEAVDDAVEDIPVLDVAFDELPSLVLEPSVEAEPVVDMSAEAEMEDADAEIQIGPVSISPVLFDIFSKEAEQRLKKLNEELQLLADTPGAAASEQLLHAAHTMCGICRTAGFSEMGDLGHALELCIAAQSKAPELFDAPDLELWNAAAAKLGESLAAIDDKQAPESAPKLIQQLEALTQKLRAPAHVEEPTASLEDTVILDLAPEPELQIAAEPGNTDEVELTLDELVVDLEPPSVEATESESTELAVPALDEAELVELTLDDAGDIAVQALPVAETPEMEELVLELDEASLESVAVDEVVPALEADTETELTLEADGGVESVIEVQQSESPATDASLDLAAMAAAEPVASEAAPLHDVGVSTAEAAFAVQDDIDEQLLDVFLEEANELQPSISKILRDWRQQPDSDALSQSLQRVLHTLKGSARMTGAMRLGEATHNLEAQVIALQGKALSNDQFDELEAGFDIINELLDLLQGKPEAAVVGTLAGTTAAAAVAAAPPPAMPMGGPSEAELAKTTLRVRADLVDRLVNQAGEVAIARSRMEAEMLALKQSLLDLTDNVSRLRGQLREIEIQAESQMASRLSHIKQEHDEFDPLEFDRFTRLQELTRFMAESVNDVATVQHNLLKNLDETESALLSQGRMTKDLQQELMRIRMVPFSSVSERLYRIVRQAGKEVGKKVNLEIRGGRVEIDRSMLEKLTAPFEHMLRNSIDHGLEAKDKRAEIGKPEVGEIVLSLKQEGNELNLTLSDDGAGLNLPKILQKAREKGLVKPDEQLTDEQIMYLIFEPGFSTADAVTQLSGRGIGMDVVKSEISDLGGRIQLDSQPGQGSTFTLHLPLTLAVTQTVLVMAGTRKYAIPSVMVEQVQELKLADLEKLYENKKVTWMGADYPFAYLPRLLGDSEHVPETKRFSTVMLLRSGNQRIALHVDELVKNQEVVVKNIGPQLARVPGIAGATVLGNGEVVLILNPLLLVNRVEAVTAMNLAAGVTPVQTQAEHLAMVPVVMVVDDSLTVRKISGRLLAREGYQVVTAKDGVDALQQIMDVVPDVMLVDIEMPRMDGFELTRHIRADEKTRNIPIIIISSRTAEKHRNYAKELGVNVFLGKPYQEEELLGHIERFVADKKNRTR